MGNGGLSNGEILSDIDIVGTQGGNRRRGNERVLNIADGGNIDRAHIEDIQICRCRCVREGKGVENTPNGWSLWRNREKAIWLIDSIDITERAASIKISYIFCSTDYNGICLTGISSCVSDSNHRAWSVQRR